MAKSLLAKLSRIEQLLEGNDLQEQTHIVSCYIHNQQRYSLTQYLKDKSLVPILPLAPPTGTTIFVGIYGQNDPLLKLYT
jgi:hypothetical protein